MPAPLPAVNGSSSPVLSIKERSLLQPLESARDHIARRLVQEQVTVTGPDLNHAVIASILQVLFLRAGEDRGFVEPGTLALLAESDGIGKRMARACSDAGLDPEILFDYGPDGPRPVPAIPDPPLREFIDHAGSAGFSAPLTLTPEECAAVFEYLLGMRLEVGEGYRMKKTGKSAVLYTGSVDVPDPQVVRYVVNGPLRTIIRDASMDPGRIRILDPSCGAGIFLLAAYRSLARKRAPGVQPDASCRSLFGTDIDPESVSTARFVLLLAFIEENQLPGSMPVSADRIREIATCLSKTIRCGNALIAPDYFSGKSEYPFNAEERRRVNPYDWKKTFPDIFAAGGFDLILGAPPPYRPFSIRSREEYFQTHYDVYAQSAGLYGYFIEKGLSLLRPGGILSVLVPGAFLRSRNARPLRRFLLSRQIEEIADTGRSRAMQGGEARMYILRLRNQTPDRPFVVSAHEGDRHRRDLFSPARRFTLDQRLLGDGGWILEDTRAADLAEKLRTTGTPLDRYLMGELNPGTHRIRNNPLVVDTEMKNRLTGKAWWCRRFFIPLLRPADIRRFVAEKPSRFVISARTRREIRNCRALSRYLEKIAEQSGTPSGREDFQEMPCSSESASATDSGSGQTGPKIVFSPYQHSPAFCYDSKGSFAITNTLLSIPRDDPLLAAILNSSLGRFIITHTCHLTDRGYHVSPEQIGKFPVIAPDFDLLAEKNLHEKIVALVAQMLSLYEYLQKAKTDQERRLVQQEIEATDVKIDALVYELYGLTAEEIAVVEESVVT